MAGIIINLTDEQKRIMELIVPDAEEWVYNAVIGKMHSCLKRAVQEYTLLNSSKLTEAEMYTELAKEEYKDLPSRKERDEAAHTELINQGD